MLQWLAANPQLEAQWAETLRSLAAAARLWCPASTGGPAVAGAYPTDLAAPATWSYKQPSLVALHPFPATVPAPAAAAMHFVGGAGQPAVFSGILAPAPLVAPVFGAQYLSVSDQVLVCNNTNDTASLNEYEKRVVI